MRINIEIHGEGGLVDVLENVKRALKNAKFSEELRNEIILSRVNSSSYDLKNNPKPFVRLFLSTLDTSNEGAKCDKLEEIISKIADLEIVIIPQFKPKKK